MSGKVLTQAAEIISTAAVQVEAMLEKMDDQLIEMLESTGVVVEDYLESCYEKNEWLFSNAIYGYGGCQGSCRLC